MVPFQQMTYIPSTDEYQPVDEVTPGHADVGHLGMSCDDVSALAPRFPTGSRTNPSSRRSASRTRPKPSRASRSSSPVCTTLARTRSPAHCKSSSTSRADVPSPSSSARRFVPNSRPNSDSPRRPR